VAVCAFGAGLGASCSAGDRDRSTSAPAEPAVTAKLLPRVGAISSRFGWRRLAPGGLEARGPNFRVRLDAGVLRFSGPAGASSTSGAASFELLRIARGVEAELTAAEPVARGNLLTLDRGVAEERLEARADGLEQSWIFPRRPSGEGDLTLRLRASGMSLGGVDAEGLHFVAGSRILTYGPATWIDASHESASVSARYQRGDIVLTVPSRLVDTAAYPAVLDPVISSSFIIAPANRSPGGEAAEAAVGCSSSQCLLVWQQDSLLVARRAKLTGELLDDSVFQVGGFSTGRFAVSAEPTGGYLVAYGAYAGDANGVLGTLVGADGSVSHVPGFVIDDGADYSVPQATNPVIESAAFVGGTHVVMYRKLNIDHFDRYVARVVNGVVEGPERGVKVGGASDAAVHSLSAGNTNVLHVADNRVSRIDAASGSVLDEPAIALSPNAHGAFASSSASTFDGTNHIVVWGNSNTGELYAARLREADGQELDPDVGGSPGARLLCKAGTFVEPHASAADGRLYVTWKTNDALVAASFALDPWTSSSASCNAVSVSSTAGASDQFVSLLGGRGVGIVKRPNELRSFGFDLTSLGTASVSNELVLNYTSLPSFGVSAVTSNGRDFLFSNQQGFGRIDGVTGELLGPRVALPHAGESPPRILPNGRDYLTQVETHEDCDLGAGAVNCAGNPFDGFYTPRYYNVRLRCDGAVGRRVRTVGAPVACDGERCLAASFNISGTPYVFRVDKNGQKLDEPQQLPGYSQSISSYTRTYFTATTAPPADARQFLALAPTQSGLVVYNISGATGVVSAPVTLTQTSLSDLRAVASDGSYVTALWGAADASTGLVFNPVDDSILVQPKAIPIYLSADSQLAFDGTSYVGFESSYPGVGHWLNPALTPVAEFPTGLAGLSSQFTASNAYGRTLLVRGSSLAEYLGYAIVGQFIDNELSATDPDLAPPNCDVSGEGDIGGDGGQGGSAGASAQGGSGGAGAQGGSAGAQAGGAGGGIGGGGGTGAQVGGTASTGEPSGSAGESSAGENAVGPVAPGSAGAGAHATAGQPGSSGADGSAGEGVESGESGASDGGRSDRSTMDSCGCRVAGAPGSSTPPWHLLAGLLLFSRRRSRRANA
jgi:MYXO-CTERM domain-containing protein